MQEKFRREGPSTFKGENTSFTSKTFHKIFYSRQFKLEFVFPARPSISLPFTVDI